MNPISYLLVIAAGFFAGIVNTLAGSGSLITLPVLIFLGLPANVANGTNRVGVVLQNLVAGASFRRSGVLDGRGSLVLSATAILGAILGAQIAVDMDEELMRRSIGAVMLLMLVVMLLRPQRWLKGELLELQGWASWQAHVAMFFVGVYGGFIQAGVGIFMLAALVLVVGYDLVRANAVKIVVVLIFTIFALGVFVLNAQVDWGMGLLLGVGNMLGAWTAARMAVRRGAEWVRRVVLIVVAFSALYLLVGT